MKHRNFCVLILSHGRANNVVTVDTLNKFGYTGDWFILLDSFDESKDEYVKRFGVERILIFDKQRVMDAPTTDAMDNFKFSKSIMYARQAALEAAKDMGYQYFAEYEDDYDSVRWRMNPEIEYSSKMLSKEGNVLDKVFDAMITYLEETPRLQSICMAQSGDYIGGGNSRMIQEQSRRKVMNSWIIDVDRPFDFAGTMNDDVVVYSSLTHRGVLFLTTGFIAINQKQTQSGASGNTDMYKKFGTYAKAFYSVIGCPSGVKISTLSNLGDRVNTKEFRVHHQVDWKSVAPKILRQNIKKSLTSKSDMVNLSGIQGVSSE